MAIRAPDGANKLGRAFLMIGLLLNGLAFAGESQGGADVPVEENIGGGTTEFYFISREGVKKHTFYAGVDPPLTVSCL